MVLTLNKEMINIFISPLPALDKMGAGPHQLVYERGPLLHREETVREFFPGSSVTKRVPQFLHATFTSRNRKILAPKGFFNVSLPAAPAWGCEARLELDAAQSANSLKASRVGVGHLFQSPNSAVQGSRLAFLIPECRLGTWPVPIGASKVPPRSPENPRELLEWPGC